MTYIDYINNMHLKADWCPLTANDIAVYMALLNVANRHYWPAKFKVATSVLLRSIHRMSRKSFTRSRDRLKEAGLIDFTEGNFANNVIAEYRLLEGEKPAEKPQSAESSQTTPSSQSTSSSPSSQSTESAPSTPTAEYNKDVVEEVRILKESPEWLESVAAAVRSDAETIRSRLEEFANHCIAYEAPRHRSLSDAKQHFINWINKPETNINHKQTYTTYNGNKSFDPYAGYTGVPADYKKVKEWDAPFI